jgi:uncharacterized protein (DUF3820 family)
VDAVKLSFGRFIGQDICDIPLDYIRWLEEQHWISAEMREACQYEIERRTGNMSSLGRSVQPGEGKSRPHRVSLVNPK